MDPNQSTPSSSTSEGMVPIAQLEQLFTMIQPNFNLSHAIAALAPPPPAQTPAIPPASEATPSSAPITDAGDNEAAGADLVDPTVGNPSMEVEGGHEDDNERAGVAPEQVEEELALTDAEGVEMVRTRMASEDVENSVDTERVEEVMAEIEAEIREGRTPTVEGLERGETGVGRIETREKEREVIFYVSDSEEEEVQQIVETEAQILSASRLRRKFLLEESKEEIEPPRVVVEAQNGGASRRRRKILAEEPEEKEEEEEVLRSQPEVPKQVEQVAQPAPTAELERKRKGKQPELPPGRSSDKPPPR